jgi:two-component system, chemotaxis family, chemotaxis protein CheY
MQSTPYVFIIDDDQIACLIAKMTIEKYFPAYKTHTYHSVQSALEVLTFISRFDPQNLPAIVLLDLEMPLENGWDFLDTFQAMFNHPTFSTPQVCIVTNSLHEEDVRRSTEYPCVEAFFTKPLSREMLAMFIEKAYLL